MPNARNIQNVTTALGSASFETVFERLRREQISDDLAWWLACLDLRVSELWGAHIKQRKERAAENQERLSDARGWEVE